MANKIKSTYKNIKILYESFNPSAGVFSITIGYWQNVGDFDDFDRFKSEVLHTKFYKNKPQYTQNQILCWGTGDSDNARRIRKNKNIPFYSDFELTIKLNKPKATESRLKTFKTNLPIVKKDIEDWLDYLFGLPYAPKPITKKGNKLLV